MYRVSATVVAAENRASAADRVAVADRGSAAAPDPASVVGSESGSDSAAWDPCCHLPSVLSACPARAMTAPAHSAARKFTPGHERVRSAANYAGTTSVASDESFLKGELPDVANSLTRGLLVAQRPHRATREDGRHEAGRHEAPRRYCAVEKFGNGARRRCAQPLWYAQLLFSPALEGRRA